ncbi:4-hydroxy-3-methylbut-2-enyl diphosphate reductase : 4-hydroxy-3-methylbut-2-enyl diphosphate reductase OS=Pirellula staleyi (strain ATCC 27377 / DSM 6068 / ICPB 4128) GN=ispH PE=3 SV=1: LYTB [Gemmata massiliana]|uniref:4-hydroxy-3-methylbut-2-enyl diphosphate reductase n=1 Tax=Gemmata massiliana TaxID=1210884 RepID=A0A6P2D2I5_9BACT|nr:4-hydroxy-3-methylbut-2-enyl diphosphate reductase [Gemmata massiliana]VTR95538.1 4-hydroxy-3-methylbut-2-enyl diphosphate reductase : 4-hydroxy-3-methylbut-2-enyl diphosphate reductase OS=Pirellula staleyi (strain ATCC 27377 / DSM 6068 / ICPB 4128) GN=ispH PE=3 SV=1: LYTB [Gemmata massiliana]
MKIILANPRGFCAGVNMAIDALETALRHYGSPLYVYHEIVHNRPIVEKFQKLGVVFVDDIAEVPVGGTVLYSAHGISPVIRKHSEERNLRAIDATCPLVTKVHKEAIKFAREGYTIVLIGHEGHDEVIGTMGEAPANMVLVEDAADVEALTLPADTKLAFLTQTTLSVDEAKVVIDALKLKYPQIVGPNKDDICYATQNRQDAVKKLVGEADAVLVLGSQNSSNSQRLAELARTNGKPAYLIDRVSELKDEWFRSTDTVLVTAGASAPEEHVQDCINYLCAKFSATVEPRVVREEDVSFPLPRELRVLTSA